MSRFTVHQLKEVRVITERLTNAEVFVPPRGWRGRVATWMYRVVMPKLHCLQSYWEPMESVERHVIDSEDVVRRLLESYDALAGELGEGGEVLLIGARDFRKLMDSPTLSGDLAFYTEYAYSHTLFGLRVVVMDRLDGMLVLSRGDVRRMQG